MTEPLITYKDRPYSFPFEIHDNHVKKSALDVTNWHWHTSIQFCLMMEGSCTFYVNQTRIELKEGQAVFINSRQIHRTFNEHSKACRYLTFDLQPETLYGYTGIEINARFISPYITHDSIDCCHLTESESWQKDIVQSLYKIWNMFPDEGNEFEVHLQLQMIWLILYHNVFGEKSHSEMYIDDSMRNILSYIEEHYSEKIELEELAKEAGLARTYCCREFKRQMNCTIFEYLTNYRLTRSIELLREGRTVTEAAYQCGFNTASYYIRKFREIMGTTPGKYLQSSS